MGSKQLLEFFHIGAKTGNDKVSYWKLDVKNSATGTAKITGTNFNNLVLNSQYQEPSDTTVSI